MGRALLVGRLAVRNIRRHPAEAALLVVVIMAAPTMLTLGLALHGVTDNPYQRTREATAGADVVATVAPTPISSTQVVGPADRSPLQALAHPPGVVDHSGSYPAIPAQLEVNGVTADMWAEGRDQAQASVDQPELIQGGWVRDGGVVVEAAFADALGVGAGDLVTLNGRSFRVVGVAITAAALYGDVCFGQECAFQYGSGPDMLGPPPRGPPDGQTVTGAVQPSFRPGR